MTGVWRGMTIDALRDRGASPICCAEQSTSLNIRFQMKWALGVGDDRKPGPAPSHDLWVLDRDVTNLESRLASLLLSYIQAVCAFVAPRQPGASTAIIDRLSHSRALSQCPLHSHDRRT